MNKGQGHSDITKAKISAGMRDAWLRAQSSNGPAANEAAGQPANIDETAVRQWLNELGDREYYSFVKTLVQRYREIHEADGTR